MKILPFISQYAQRVSQIVVRNLFEVNIKDYPLEDMEAMAKEHSPQDIIDMFKNRYAVVAQKDDVIEGVVSCYPNGEKGFYHIATFFVNPDCQGCGIGRLLFEDIKEYAAKNNAVAFTVDASLSSPDFYEKMGFTYEKGAKIPTDNENYKMIYRF